MSENKSIIDQYFELISLTKDFLVQEYHPTTRLFSSLTEYHYFFELAKQKQNSKQEAPKEQIKSQAIIQPQALPLKALAPQAPRVLDTPKIVSPSSLPEPNDSKVKTEKFSTPVKEQKTVFKPIVNETGKKTISTAPSFFVPGEPFTQPAIDTLPIKKSIQECFPKLELIDTPPDDTEAKQNAALWNFKPKAADVILLISSPIDSCPTLLSNLKNAIQITYNLIVQIVHIKSIDDQFLTEIYQPNVKLILANLTVVQEHPKLKLDYKENTHTLKETPLINICAVQNYLDEPQRKSLLWKEIEQFFQRE